MSPFGYQLSNELGHLSFLPFSETYPLPLLINCQYVEGHVQVSEVVDDPKTSAFPFLSIPPANLSQPAGAWNHVPAFRIEGEAIYHLALLLFREEAIQFPRNRFQLAYRYGIFRGLHGDGCNDLNHRLKPRSLFTRRPTGVGVRHWRTHVKRKSLAMPLFGRVCCDLAAPFW